MRPVAWFWVVTLGASFSTVPANGVELLFRAGGEPFFTGAQNCDFDGDGASEICYTPTSGDRPAVPNTVLVRNLAGDVLWSYELELPPGACPEECFRTGSFILGFGDFDPSPGREAYLFWRACDDAGCTVRRSGRAIVSTSSGSVLATFSVVPPSSLSGFILGDTNGDGTDEFVVHYLSPNSLEVWGYRRSVGAVDDQPGSGAGVFARSAPNPMGALTRFVLELPRASAVVMRLYDVAGRSVLSRRWETLTSGRHEIPWDGRDENGMIVPSGVYYYDAEANGAKVQQRLVIVR